MGNITCVLQRKGDLDGAYSTASRVLEVGEKELGPMHPKCATIINVYGMASPIQAY